MEKIFNAVRSTGWRRGPRKLLGGVLGGLSEKTGIDVAFVRIGYLVFCLLPGPAFVIYALAWLLLPAQDGKIALEGFLGRRSGSGKA